MSPEPVYDDEKDRAQADLKPYSGVPQQYPWGHTPEDPNGEQQDLEEQEASGGIDDGGTASQRKEKESLKEKTGLYRHEGEKGDSPGKPAASGRQAGLRTALFGAGDGLRSRVGNMSGRKKALLFGGGLAGGGLAILIPIMIIIFSSMLIPNLGEHIAGWQFARTARAFRQSVTQINAEKIAVDSADDVTNTGFRKFYGDARSATWGKLDKWRPELTYKNMKATGKIDFQYGEPVGLLGYKRLEAVRLNGETIPIDRPTLGRRVLNRGNPLTAKTDIILAAQVDAALEKGLQGHNSLIRGRVAKKIYSDLGIELHWWDKQGKTYKGTQAADADLIELREKRKRIGADKPTNSLTKPVQDATEAADESQKKCLADDECAKQYLEPDPEESTGALSAEERALRNAESPTTFLDDATETVIANTLEGGGVSKVTEHASAVAAIASTFCVIYDGSVERSGDTVDQASESAMKSYQRIASASAQQRSGSQDTSAEAIGATNRSLQNIGMSIPEQRARNRNKPVSTDGSIQSPQASAAGTFGLMGALFGNDVGAQLDSGVEPLCTAVSSVWGQITLGAIELGVAFFTGGTSKAGSLAAQESVKVGVGQVLKELGANLLTKKALKRMLFTSAAEASATLLARMLVVSRLNTQNNGIARGVNDADLADAGGNLMAGEMGRKMMYGRTMTQPEVAYSEEADRVYLAQQKGQEGVFERYFAMSNPDSLLVNMGVSMSQQLTQKDGIAKLMATTAPRFSSSVFGGGMLGSLNPFKKQIAFAQTTTEGTDTNYNLVQWGWTEDELALVESDPTYFPLENDVLLERSGKKDEIEKKYGECYEKTMGTLLKERLIERDDQGRIHENAGKCAPKKLSRNNDEGYGDLVFRWRISKRAQNTLDHLTDIQQPTASEEAGANPANPGGGLGISPDGFVFPLKTTKSVLTTGKDGSVWCATSSSNCHHDYNAADIFAPTGTTVVAARGGKVIYGRNNPTGGTGSEIAIMGDDKNVYWYGHMKSGSVKFLNGGETIKAGDELGQVGENADAQNTASHLHFDVQPPPATTRNGCINAACAQPPFNFLDPQPALIKAYEGLPS